MASKKKFYSGIRQLIELFFPRKCPICGRRLTGKGCICIFCLSELPHTHYHAQPDNPLEQHFLGFIKIEKATGYFFYNKESHIHNILYQLKYHNHRQMGIFMGECMATHIQQNSDFFRTIDLIVPVPLAKSRLRARGYNQCDLIAQGISSITHLPIAANTLKRNVDNPTQTHKNRNERWKNVQGIFSVENPELLENKHILIIDDVITTGATLNSCATAIASIPGTKISIATLAVANFY